MRPGLKIVVAAEPIENGAGLATFTLDAVAEFAQARPEWRFTVLVQKAFSDAAALREHPNVEVVFCDDVGLRRRINALLPCLRGRDRALDLMARLAPATTMRRALGNLTEIWKTLPQYDVVWVPHFAISRNVWPALYSPEVLKTPVLLTIHDLHAAVFPDAWRQYPRIVDNFWNRFKPYAQRAAAVITHSEFQKRSIIEHFGIAPERIVVAYIPLPLDPALTATYERAEAEDTLRTLSVTAPYIFCPLSQGMPHKNHLRSIEAWALLKKQLGSGCPRLVFTSKGSAEQSRTFRDAVISRGLDDLVSFTGLVSRRQLGILYQNCQAVLSPTLYEGGGSGAVIEGTLAGKPIASSNIPVVVEHNQRLGIEAVYFDPLDPAAMADAVMATVRLPSRDPQQALAEIQKRDAGNRAQFAETYARELERIAAQR